MDPKPLQLTVLRERFLAGPNVWTYRSAMEVWLDLGELEQLPSNRMEGFNDRLLDMLPGLAQHHCGVGEPGGFVSRLHDGTWMGHVLEHCVIELLNLAGMPTGFGQTRSTTRAGVYRMVFRARNEPTATCALRLGLELLHAALNSASFDVKVAQAQLHDVVDATWLGPSTAAIVDVATKRGIPHLRLNDGNLVQLGYGAAQRRIWTAETELTSAIAEGVASDKDLTKSLLKACGVPVPEGEVVSSAAHAWRVAQDLGGAVVVKPSDANHGRGVTLDLTKQSDIERAYKVADAQGSEVIVERFLRGHEHRLLVVDGRVVAAARGEVAEVIGDGASTLSALVESQINSDARRGTTEGFPLNKLILGEDPVVLLDLERQGFSPDDVVPKGRKILVQRNGNVAIDCTDEVCAQVAHSVSLAARVVGLDVAGIDVVCEDIGKPLDSQGGGVVEVNAGPGLLMHLKPAIGQPRPVGEAIIDALFKGQEASTGRVPLVGIAGTKGAAAVSRNTAFLLGLLHGPVGLACGDGVWLGRRFTEPADRDYWAQCQRLVMNREIQSVVIEASPLMILDSGLPYDRCLVGVVTDVDGFAGLSQHDIHSSADMPRVLRTQVDVVLASGTCVLNADIPEVAELAQWCDGDCIWYASADAPSNLPGARWVLCGTTTISLWENGVVVAQAVPDLSNGDAPLDLCAAAGAAWASGLTPELIVAGLTQVHRLPAPSFSA